MQITFDVAAGATSFKHASLNKLLNCNCQYHRRECS